MAELHHRLSWNILARNSQFDLHRHGWCINSWKATIWLLILVVAMAAASMSWAVAAAPTAWLSSAGGVANSKQSLEVRSSTTGLVAGLKCTSTSTTRAQPTCVAASFDEAASGKSNNNGFVDTGSVLPIQFENGQDPPTVVFAPNRRIVASELFFLFPLNCPKSSAEDNPYYFFDDSLSS